MAATELIARYVSALEKGASMTHRAEDRPAYSSLLANAAPLLAAAVSGEAAAAILQRVRDHDRLLGQVWLQDDVARPALAAWALVKAEFY